MHHTTYVQHYTTYIGTENMLKQTDSPQPPHIHLCTSPYRDLPINKKYLYSAILTKEKDNTGWLLSCSESIKEPLLECLNRLKESDDIDYYAEHMVIEGMKTRKMYRMIREDDSIEEVPQVPGFEYIYIEKVNKYVAAIGEELAGYCKISDVIEGFGNIVVYTDEKYRHQGLATTLLGMTLAKCREQQIEPLYLVAAENTNSIKLAGKFGFTVASEEVIVSKEEANA